MTDHDDRETNDAAPTKPVVPNQRADPKVPADLLGLTQQAVHGKAEALRRRKEDEEREVQLERECKAARRALTAGAYKEARRSFSRWRGAVRAAELPLIDLGRWVPGLYSRAYAIVLPTPLPVSGGEMCVWMSDYVKKGQMDLYVDGTCLEKNENNTQLGEEDLRFIADYFLSPQIWEDIRQVAAQVERGEIRGPRRK